MNTCFIFGALEFTRFPVIPGEKDFIIAADRGLQSLKKLFIEPDITVGDFDSLGYVPQNGSVSILPVRKDDTDLGYALKCSMENGYKKIIIYGAVGGKLDHTFANTQLLQLACKAGAECIFIGDEIMITSVINGELRFKNANGRFSVFCTSSEARGVRITGAEYILNKASLMPDFPIGVSNEFKPVSGESVVSVENGILTVMWENEVLPENKSYFNSST